MQLMLEVAKFNEIIENAAEELLHIRFAHMYTIYLMYLTDFIMKQRYLLKKIRLRRQDTLH
mgnify:CR=1 FL=1